MRIVFGVGSCSHGYGMPNVVLGLAGELQDQGNDVSILTGKTNMASVVPVYQSGYNETLKHAYVMKALRVLLSLKPDIFHSHYYPMDLCGALVSQRIKHVMHVHGILNREYWANVKAALECIRSSFTESVGLRFSAKVITVSRFLESSIISKYKISPDQIEVIYPSVDLELYSPSNRLQLPNRQTLENESILISTGAISERKGQHLLVAAMREVVKEAPKTRLFLVGRTGEEDTTYILRLQERIRKFGLENSVLIKGFLPAGLLPEIYAEADIFVTGTMWEGFGLPLAEAMATGIPVVAFDTTSMHELIRPGFNGLKVPPFDIDIFAEKIVRLIQDSKLRREMGRNARRFAEKEFDTKTNICRLTEIYQSLD